MTAPTAEDLTDIQGIVYCGWNDHPYAAFVFATLGDDPARGRAWLAGVRRAITPVARQLRPRGYRLQLALAPSGLAALGLPDDVIDMLAPEVTAGMASRERAIGGGDPTDWQLGGWRARLDVLVMIYAATAELRATLVAAQRAALAAAGATIHTDELAWPMGKREHFGFADGLSQPYVAGLHPAPRQGEDRIAPGEILLGYPNAYGRTPISPVWRDVDLGRNGTYLVFRKLQQHVARFWGWIAAQARTLAGDDPEARAALTELIAAKLVGRWRSGASLTLTPERDDPAYSTPDQVNAFKFLRDDRDGLRCPLSSHVRRANPRDARGGSAQDSEDVVSRHRILRRGRSFGAPLPDDAALAGRDDDVPRGLYFICLQASVARGFEFIQQSWLTNPGFLGLHREPDPLIGGRARESHITIPAEPVRLRLPSPPTVVTNLGGGYFFVPSLSALARIAGD